MPILSPPIREVVGFNVGDRVGILRGMLKGKKGTVTQVGKLFLFVRIPGETGTPIVAKVDVIRLVSKEAA
jgi:ribosomal protein L24